MILLNLTSLQFQVNKGHESHTLALSLRKSSLCTSTYRRESNTLVYWGFSLPLSAIASVACRTCVCCSHVTARHQSRAGRGRARCDRSGVTGGHAGSYWMFEEELKLWYCDCQYQQWDRYYQYLDWSAHSYIKYTFIYNLNKQFNAVKP